jgi:hypothetical protein
VLVEVLDKVAQLLVGHLRLTDRAVEIDVLEDALKRRVLVLERGKSLVEARADVLVEVLVDPLPPRRRWRKERVVVEGGRLGPLLGFLRRAPLSRFS